MVVHGSLKTWGLPFLYTAMPKYVFLAHRHFFLFRPRVFSRALVPGARREPAGAPRRKCGPWVTSVARALGIQNGKSPRGGIPSTQGHPGPCKPTQRRKECPTARVISGILIVINVVRHYLFGDGFFFPDTNLPAMRPLLIQRYSSCR